MDDNVMDFMAHRPKTTAAVFSLSHGRHLAQQRQKLSMPFEHLPALGDVRRLLLLVDAKAGKFGFHARPIETGLGKPRVNVDAIL